MKPKNMPTLRKIIEELEKEQDSFDQIAIDEILSRLRDLKERLEYMKSAEAYMFEASSSYDQCAEKAIKEILGEKEKIDLKADVNPSKRYNKKYNYKKDE